MKLKFKTIFPVILCASIWLTSSNSYATGSEASKNSVSDISVATGSIVYGSALLVAASGELVIEGAEKVADGVIYVVKNMSSDASKAGKASIKIVGSIAGEGSLAVGQSVQVIAESTGAALIASGKLIAFIPNEIGKSLVYHEQLN